MIAQILVLATMILSAAVLADSQKAPDTGRAEVAVYYFPNYHPGDARNT